MRSPSNANVAEVRIRVNGRGNAWPLELGSTDRRAPSIEGDLAEYANTSLSVLGLGGDAGAGRVWEILFDVGQGVVPFLIRHGARLPDAVILSHPHFDHVSGLDWLVNSHRHVHGPADVKLPVYATEPCWKVVGSAFPWLLDWLEFRPLRPGATVEVPEAPGLTIRSFPVAHAEHAPGSTMVAVGYGGPPREPAREATALFTGDVVLPLLRRADVEQLRGVGLVLADSTVRFPWPACGHWSVTSTDPDGNRADRLESWRAGKDARHYVDWYRGAARRGRGRATATAIEPPLGEFASEFDDGAEACWSVVDLAARVEAREVALVHYSGRADERHYGQLVLTDDELLAWVREVGGARCGASWHVPKPGDAFGLWRSSS